MARDGQRDHRPLAFSTPSFCQGASASQNHAVMARRSRGGARQAKTAANGGPPGTIRNRFREAERQSYGRRRLAALVDINANGVRA